MTEGIEGLTERFNQSLIVLMQNLGPNLIRRPEFGLTPGQVVMLKIIEHEPFCRVSKLAELLEVAPSAITVMLDRLEHHGYVFRKRGDEDRRVVTVGLTPSGREKLDFAIRVRRQIMAACLAKLDVDELMNLVQASEKLAFIVESLDVDTMVATLLEEE